MIYAFRLLIIIFSFSSFAEAFTQEAGKEIPPVELTYVEQLNFASTVPQGSFVVKNNHLDRSLSDHLLTWQLSKNGNPVTSGNYPLDEVNAGDTKYFDLDKLFDIGLIERLRPSLITLYAEIQDTSPDAKQKLIVGESVVLAEARKDLRTSGERYQILKVGGISIYRIANGNSITIDGYNQIVGIDLGEGNLLDGPIRPFLEFSSNDPKKGFLQIIATKLATAVPSSITVNKETLTCTITYGLEEYGSFHIRCRLGDKGLALDFHAEIQVLVHPEVSCGLVVPLKEKADTISYIGELPEDLASGKLGDSPIGAYDVVKQPESSLMVEGIPLSDPVYSVEQIKTERGNIYGWNFGLQLVAQQDEKLVKRTSDSNVAEILFLKLYPPVSWSAYHELKSLTREGEWLITAKD